MVSRNNVNGRKTTIHGKISAFKISVMKKKKVALVAGGAGFLGSHVVKRLISEGLKVRIVDLPTAPLDEKLASVVGDPNLSVEQADILTLPADHKIFSGVEDFFQCTMAGNHRQSIIEPEHIFQPNLMPTIRILEAARLHPGARVHCVSSSAVYGNVAGEVGEDTPCQANTAYGLVKLFQEQAMAYWHSMYNIPTIIYRPFLCYGPGDASGGVVDVFLQKINEGKPLTLTGDGKSGRDFVHVNDVVDAFVLTWESTIVNAVFNVGTGQLTTIKKLATMMGGQIEYEEARAVDEPSYANIDRIKNEIGWQPKISLEDGIAAIMESVKRG